MDLQKIDKMIKEAKERWDINNMLMQDAKKHKNPDAYLYAKAIVRYMRIIDRLEKSRLNYL